MPTLANVVSRIERNMRYLVSEDDIIAALNEAGFALYTRVLKEAGGFFLKEDTTSLVLTPAQQVYALPVDCTQILHMAERAQPTDPWLVMQPETLDQAYEDQQSYLLAYGVLVEGVYGQSAFSYYGPYLDNSQTANASPEATNTAEVQSVRISPVLDQQRSVQLVYTAKWIDILDDSSATTLPAEAYMAMHAQAMATLCASADDMRAANYAQQGEALARAFLSWVRDRQLQQGPKVEPYL